MLDNLGRTKQDNLTPLKEALIIWMEKNKTDKKIQEILKEEFNENKREEDRKTERKKEEER